MLKLMGNVIKEKQRVDVATWVYKKFVRG